MDVIDLALSWAFVDVVQEVAAQDCGRVAKKKFEFINFFIDMLYKCTIL
jgi:hypothetical protein